MDFMTEMKNTLNTRKTLTKNGAVAYRTSGKELLDLNFAVASLRSATEAEIGQKFTKAFFENPELACKWLFFARDVREGLGERRLFRVCFKVLEGIDSKAAIKLIKYIPEYGRYDDLFAILSNDDENIINKEVYRIVFTQLMKDEIAMNRGGQISLLAKWAPSINTSSKKTMALAKRFCKHWDMSYKEYRKSLAALRKYLEVVETKMCANEWGDIDYSAVPSKANLIYSNAFMKHDELRRLEYLENVAKGTEKINSSVAFPHDIVSKYDTDIYRWGWNDRVEVKEDATLEAMWKALPDTVKGNGNTLVVADGSGSMTCKIDPKSRVTALNVAHALAIYFAERSSGAFKDKYITFSSNPQIVDLSNCNTLAQKLELAYSHSEVSDTDIESTFDLILETAIKNNASQEDIPVNVLIISDMHFNMACVGIPDKTLFEEIEQKFVDAGYKMPRLIFWNVNSGASVIPLQQNELGVALVSGFSVNVVNMVMSGELDPYKVLVEQLMSPRYECITLD